MRYKQFGSTDLRVSQIGFGAMHLPNLSQSEASTLVNHALDKGITYIDTAQNYFDSEEKIGRAINHRRSEFILGTKTNKRTYKQAKAEIEDSLIRLKTDYLDILHIHYVNSDDEFAQVMSEDGAMRAVEEAKKAGYIRYIAISSHRPDKLAEWVHVYPFDSVLFHLNVCQPFAATDLLPTAKELKIGTIAMKALAGGFVNPIHLRYLLTQDVDIILPGFTTTKEIDENIKVVNDELPDSIEQQQLIELATVAGLHGCRRCNRCECPQGIKITDTVIPSIYLTEIEDKATLQELWKAKRGPVELCRSYQDCQIEAICEKMCPYQVPIRQIIREKICF